MRAATVIFNRPSLPSFYVILIFYIISFCSLIEGLGSYLYIDYQSVATGTKPLFAWIPDDIQINTWISFLFPMVMLALIVLLPFTYLHFVRVVWFVITFLIEGFQFQYVNGHSGHMYVWISLFFALIHGNLKQRSDNDLELKAFVRLAQLQIFLIYGVAGIWKTLAVLKSFWNDSIAAGFDFVPYAMASEFLYSNKQSAASLWVIEQPVLCFLLSSLVLFAQAGSIVVAFFPRLYFLWGLVLACFHVGTLFTVNVFFKWSVPPIVLFLCISPLSEEGFRSLFCVLGKSWKSNGKL